ncbi:MAG: hypothetical protein DRN15_00155 [Thermoprotei archaeon]|nr:MAG: hypothetical protein DRN15_00155 [Thermoprotei archaeon]RLF25744.1 MAG: hypothetical protein DRM97_00795 [Thermoprotei archaeon]
MRKGHSADDMMKPLHDEPREDEELELLRRKKLLELQKKLLIESIKREEREETDPEDIVRRNLTEKAQEVFEAAKAQYPMLTKRLVPILAKLIVNKEVETPIDAIRLYNIYLNLGVRIRLPTRIRFYEKGRYIDLKEKLRKES